MTLFKLNNREKRSMKMAFFGVMLVGVAYAIAVIDPLDLLIRKQLSIWDGSFLFSLFKKPPLDVFIRIYVFNITNANAFLNGSDVKLKLNEIGPYVYQEFLEHQNYTFHENGTLSYVPVRRVEFVPERSIGDPKFDIVTVPNIPMIGTASAAAKASIFAAFALNTLMGTLNAKPLLNLTIQDYLWGYNDPLVKLASNFLPTVIHFEKFGLLDRMFDEGENLVTIHLPEYVRQQKLKEEAENPILSEFLKTENIPIDNSKMGTEFRPKDFSNTYNEDNEAYKPVIRDFSMDRWNGQHGISYWGYSDVEGQRKQNTVCNTLRGAYDGTIFPQNITQNEQFRLYRKAFCRTLPIHFDHAGTVEQLDAYFFKLDENAFNSDIDDPNSSCFCDNKKCLKKGLGNITPCYYNIPTAVSFPHFYLSDPTLLDGVEGLSPDADKHGSEIVLQPNLGVPMRVHTRVQLNLLIDNPKFNSVLKKLEGIVLPIVWVEIGIERLTPWLIVLLRVLFNVLPHVQVGCIYGMSIIGVSLFAAAALLCTCVPKSSHKFNPKTDVRYSAIYMFPYIKREIEKYSEEDAKCEAV